MFYEIVDLIPQRIGFTIERHNYGDDSTPTTRTTTRRDVCG
jgi:hypothetical protein